MAVSAERVAVADTAAVALNADSDSVAGTSLVVMNLGAGTVDVGGPTVAAGVGFELEVDESVTVSLAAGEVLYAITTEAATATVCVLRTGA